MNNSPLFPFERNRYYAGKMLTSADFAAEQGYMNDKRRFLNNMMFGSGIVCGCNVYSLDDLSVFVESGFAVDRLGREIVIDTSVVKKLSAIDGFDRIESNQLTLCLKYKEENVHPVYSVGRHNSENEYETNRIREGYELFLADSGEVGGTFEFETEFLAADVMYQDADYEIKTAMPATVCLDQYVKLEITASKLSDSQKPFSFEGVLQLPAFQTQDGGHELTVEFEGLNLLRGESVRQEFWLLVQDTAVSETSLMLKNGICRISSGDREQESTSSLAMKIMISDITPKELVDRELGKVSLELRGIGDVQDFICLADISLLRTDSAYIIEHIEERNVKKYIETPAQSILRSEYLEYFRGRELAGRSVRTAESRNQAAPQYSQEEGQIQVASGTLEIPVGGRAKSGEVFYSGEIMHGLGAGTVYVDIGQELIEQDRAVGANVKSTIYGNGELFRAEKGMPEAETAVKVLNDKGSFIVAARFAQETNCLMLTYRWVAIRFSGRGATRPEETADQWIEAETPTVVLGVRDSYYFGVRFHNIEECSIGYAVLENGGGEISADGVYTAPNKEGVFEIRIFCADKPFICTYAYAIVKKK